MKFFLAEIEQLKSGESFEINSIYTLFVIEYNPITLTHTNTLWWVKTLDALHICDSKVFYELDKYVVVVLYCAFVYVDCVL